MGKILSLFQHSSIKNKLMVIIMFIITILLILSFVIFTTYDIITTRQNMVRELSLVVDIIGKRTAPALQFNATDKAADNLADLKSKDSVLMACIYNSDSKVFTQFRTNESLDCPDNPTKGTDFSRNFLTIYQDIYTASGTYLGAIYVMEDMREVREHITQFTFNTFGLMFVAIVIAYLITLKVQKIISAPIESLTDTARIVHTDGNYSVRTEKYYNDEIGILADTFNEMLTVVESRNNEITKINAELTNTNENLELKVKERTHDLEIRSKDLEEAMKRAEEAMKKAEAANEAKSEFLRNMSHEFRTPLHGMKNMSEFGLRDTKKSDFANMEFYFQKITKTTNRLTELVDGVLNISRMENGTEEFIMERADVFDMFEIVRSEQSASVQQKGLILNCIRPDFDTEIICHRGKIIQVITNFIGNAIKFTPSGKQITLYAGRDDNYLTISVSDEGVGIPEEELETIFGKFVQSTRTKTGAGGTGLGLAICKGIILGHEGKIWAENNKNGIGSTFHFTIPYGLAEGKKIINPETL